MSKIVSYMIHERLLEHASATDRKDGMVKAEIDDILAIEFRQDLLAPMNAAYTEERARILGEAG